MCTVHGVQILGLVKKCTGSNYSTQLKAARFKKPEVESEECWFITQESELLASWVEDHSLLRWVWTNQAGRKRAVAHALQK